MQYLTLKWVKADERGIPFDKPRLFLINTDGSKVEASTVANHIIKVLAKGY